MRVVVSLRVDAEGAAHERFTAVGTYQKARAHVLHGSAGAQLDIDGICAGLQRNGPRRRKTDKVTATLDPPQQSGPVSLLSTAYAEKDGKPVPVKRQITYSEY